MTLDKDKFLNALTNERNNYQKECYHRVNKEYGKIEGADYMLERILAILSGDCEAEE